MAGTSKQAIAKAQGGKRRYHEVAQDESKATKKAVKTGTSKKASSKKVSIAPPAPDSDSEGSESDEEAAAKASRSVRNSLAKKGSLGSDSESDEEDKEDGAANPNAPVVDIVRLPSSKDDKAVRARLDAVQKRRSQQKDQSANVGVVYVGRVPKGFNEPQMTAYFNQFGPVTRLRLSRNPKTSASRHFGFVEFQDADVAKIVAETMDNYLIMGHLLQVKAIPADEVHPDLFRGASKWRQFAGKTLRQIEDQRVQLEHERHDRPRTAEEQKKTDDALLQRQEQRREKLKSKGIDYDFPGYQVA